jgi:carbonic anhydrase
MLRREFLGLLPAAALMAQPASPSGDDVLRELMEGNARFIAGRALNPHQNPAELSKLASGQRPKAVIIGCADSRVSPEILFDQGLGDLFVIRVAGNIVSGGGAVVKGSIAYAVVELGAQLIMVLGHSGCGAVTAALEKSKQPLPKSIHDLVHLVETGNEKDVDRAVIANVRSSVTKLRNVEPTIAKYIETKRIRIAGAVDDLASGKVTVVA